MGATADEVLQSVVPDLEDCVRRVGGNLPYLYLLSELVCEGDPVVHRQIDVINAVATDVAELCAFYVQIWLAHEYLTGVDKPLAAPLDGQFPLGE